VAGGGDDELAFGDGALDGGAERVVGFGRAERHADDVGAGVGGPVDAGGDVCGGAAAIVAEDFADEQAAVGSYPYDAEIVLACGDGAGGVGAVAVLVGGAEATGGEVAGVVNGIGQIGMRLIDAGVEDGDADGAAARVFPMIRNVVGGQ